MILTHVAANAHDTAHRTAPEFLAITLRTWEIPHGLEKVALFGLCRLVFLDDVKIALHTRSPLNLDLSQGEPRASSAWVTTRDVNVSNFMRPVRVGGSMQ